MERGLKHTGFIIILLLLLLPLLQHTTGIFHLKPLKGAFTILPEPDFSFRHYFSGDYQEKYNDYLEQNIGMRPLLVRINNQIAYTLFNETQASAVVIGKKGYLFEENYIKAYYGTDFRGEKEWDDKLDKLCFIIDHLNQYSTEVILFLAPGKATFFPEYIPDDMKPEEKRITNHEYLVRKCKEKNLHCIDFNTYFVNLKDTSSYALYPKTGIHWSLYGVGLALDSIINYMEYLSGKNIVDFGWNQVIVSGDLKEPDNDIGEGMNLLFDISWYDMPYPRFYFREDSTTFKPEVITIADSYYWSFHGKGLSQRIYDKDKFWYYYKSVHGDVYEKGLMIEDLDVPGEIKSADYIVLLATDANLYKYPFGFIDHVYELLKNEKSQKGANFSEDLIRKTIRNIKSDSLWFRQVKDKAREMNISVDEMLRKDAIWILEKRK